MKRSRNPSTSALDLAAPFNRRAFLRGGAATLAASALSLSRSLASAEDTAGPVIDTNTYLGPCPFRQLPQTTLLEKPDTVGVFAGSVGKNATTAWASSFEALLRRDYDDVNDRLFKLTQADKNAARQFQLFGAINPKVSGWRETLRRIHQDYRMRGIRLHPNYHGYTLDDPDFAALLDAAAQRDLIVQIALRMEDIRTQHPAASVADVDPRPLTELLPVLPGLKIQLLNAMHTLSDRLLLARLSDLGVHFEIAMLEGMAGIARLVERVPEIRLCYGSYAPFFYTEAAALKLVESAPELDPRIMAGIRSHHAENLLLRS
ncbi:MAG: hypothetical protein KDN19_13480 [Verrucomicrobiae bacterium]|nr:hypothetical protein [Verrucomicrobiae bacterium]